MALYESVFIARQDISSTQVDALADNFQKVIEDGGGQVPKRENWGLRSLAYKIKKNRKGHYVLFNIDSPSEAVLEYERTMKLNEDILRYMTLRVDELDPEPSVVMQGRGRGERSERGERGRRFEERPNDRDKRADAAKTGDASPAETKTAVPEKTETAKPDEATAVKPDEATAAKPAEAKEPEAKSAGEKTPKVAAKTAKPKIEKAIAAKKTDAKPAKSEKPAADDKKAKKAAPAKEDKKSTAVKKAAATKKKGEKA